MAWNEQYARILEQMKKSSSVNASITGADSKTEEPDCLFYTNFSRESAIAFYEVFEAFKEYYKSNPSLAVDRLKSNLKMQIDSMNGVCPVEVMLYSSRIIRDYLGNRPIKLALISLIQQYLPTNLKSVQYILSGWEWPQILSIVVEACGKTNNDEVIKLAMRYCPSIAQKFVDKNDSDVLKSYITMIENTQNEAYIGYLSQIATLPQFDVDNVLGDHLIKELRRNRFLADHKETIAREIHAKTGNYSLKRNLEKILDNKNPAADTGAFNMAGLNYEIKAKQIAAMDFTKNPSVLLREFEQSRESDRDIILLICQKVLKDIPAMWRASDKNHAMIMVATKGQRIKGYELISDICALQNACPELAVTTKIALSEISPGQYPLEEAMYQIIVDSEIESWSWAIGKYFRFRKQNFEKNLLRAFLEKSASIGKMDMSSFLARFKTIVILFNGNNDLLSTQPDIQKNIFEIIRSVMSGDLTESACKEIVELLEFMLKYSANCSLDLLDEMKRISKTQQYDELLIRVNDVIKKGDLAREPD